VNVGERFWQLNFLLKAAVCGKRWESEFGGEDETLRKALDEADPQRKKRAETWNRLVEEEVDWSEAFRQYNAWHDRRAAAFDHATWSECIEELTALDEEGRAHAEESLDLAAPDEPLPAPEMSPEDRARCLVGILVGAVGVLGTCLLTSEQKRQVYCDMMNVAIALAGYRSDHGTYPNCLEQLRFQYIADVPLDAFSNDDLHYEREGDGYLLYSVGPNGVNDGGRNFYEEFENCSELESATEEERARDDIAIRTPTTRDGAK